MEIFVVDSNFFIQAYRLHYPFDVVPGFWLQVKRLAEEGRIISIDKVRDEIYRNEDALKIWCTEHLPVDFFKETSGIISQYQSVTSWAVSRSNHYTTVALRVFLDAEEADAWLVSYALADKATFTLVTHERSDPNRKNNIKIPQACQPFGVNYINTIEMFRKMGVRF